MKVSEKRSTSLLLILGFNCNICVLQGSEALYCSFNKEVIANVRVMDSQTGSDDSIDVEKVREAI